MARAVAAWLARLSSNQPSKLSGLPSVAGRGERGGGRLDDQANFLYRQQQLAAGLVVAAQPVEHVAIEQAPRSRPSWANASAVKTQGWTNLICMMLLRYLHLRSRFGWCLSNRIVLMNLFTHRDLHA